MTIDLWELDGGGSDGPFLGQFVDACGYTGALSPQEEMNVNRLPRYTVTMSSRNSNVEVFQVDAVDATMKLVASDVCYRVAKVGSMVASDGTIVNFTSPLKGRVCLYCEPDLDDINQVQAIAAKTGAVALFVLLKPSCAPSGDLPVFQITNTLMDKLWSMRLPQVTFKLCTMTQKATSSPNSATAGATNSLLSDKEQANQKMSHAQVPGSDGPNLQGCGPIKGIAKATGKSVVTTKQDDQPVEKQQPVVVPYTFRRRYWSVFGIVGRGTVTIAAAFFCGVYISALATCFFYSETTEPATLSNDRGCRNSSPPLVELAAPLADKLRELQLEITRLQINLQARGSKEDVVASKATLDALVFAAHFMVSHLDEQLLREKLRCFN